MKEPTNLLFLQEKPHQIVREPYKVQDDSPERSILARLILPDQRVEADPLEELHGLATTAGTQVVDELVQRRATADHSTYLGKGKVEELRLMVERHDADVVVFDPETIQDHATFVEPHQYASGMVHVFVNGEQVLKDGEHTGALPGRVVRGPGWQGER